MPLDPNRWTLKTQEAFNTAVAAANATPEPDVWSDFLRAPEALRYWTVAGQEVVPIAALPPGCP
mgnify:CR=1 FL=1